MSDGKRSDVLVIGAGLVGLSMAVCLASHGVRVTVLERRSGACDHPRSRGLNPRTMELFRELGLEERVRASGSARTLERNAGVIVAETLAGQQVGALDGPYFGDRDADYVHLSPCEWCMCHQDEVEPLLRERAEELGVRVCFDHELVDLRQDRATVRATVRTRHGGGLHERHAAYLVAADGAGSAIRSRLGIEQTGRGMVARFMNIDFVADLAGVLGDRRFIMCYLTGAGVRCALLPVDNASRWMLHVVCRSGEPDGFTEQRCVELVRAATGVPDLPVRVRSALPWESAARTATRWRDGRVFLAGDAAHVMPPTGAFGANTGIQDAHNLAWKLAMVLHDAASPALLDTYEQERMPVAMRTVEQAVLRAQDRPRIAGAGAGAGGAPDAPPAPDPAIQPDPVVIFQYRYQSGAVIDDRVAPAGPWSEHLDGSPGTLAPPSTVDRPGGGFTLVVGPSGGVWCEGAHAASRRTGVPLAIRVSDCARYGISRAGASLVRPDGFVAWRTWRPPRDPEEALVTVLSRVLHRGPDIGWPRAD